MMDDDDLNARSEIEKAAAARLCLALANYLKLSGYQYVCISIAKLIEAKDGPEVSAPGATILEAHDRCLPIFPHQAGVLGDCMSALDKRFRASGAQRAPVSLSEEVDYLKGN
jgi:hypothetical protein